MSSLRRHNLYCRGSFALFSNRVERTDVQTSFPLPSLIKGPLVRKATAAGAGLGPVLPDEAVPSLLCSGHVSGLEAFCSEFSPFHGGSGSISKWIRMRKVALPRWHQWQRTHCQCRAPKRCRFDPWVRKIPWKRAQQTL